MPSYDFFKVRELSLSLTPPEVAECLWGCRELKLNSLKYEHILNAMVLKTLPKTDYSCSPSICRALHESDCALATSNQCQANNVQNVLRNTIQSRGGCGPRNPSSSVPLSQLKDCQN